jgi:hypothetical protein
MDLYSPRLPHVLTRAHLASLLAPTYARENGVSDELSLDRMKRVIQNSRIANHLYEAISAGLRSSRAGRSEDAVIDALAHAAVKRSDTLGPAPRGPGLSAVTVMLNIELGLSPDALRATLDSGKGKALLDQGLGGLGKFMVDHLLR